jgi:nucleoid-associated protein YgaU
MPADKQQPDFSDVQSGMSSTAPSAASTPSGTTAIPLPEPAPELKTYTVEPGDSLWKIAQRAYGHGNQWQKIYEANKDRIKNPDKIDPGQTLVIPD